MHRHQLAFHRNASDQVEEESLARAILADHDAKGRTAFGQPVYILDKSCQLTRPSDLDQVLPDTRNDTRAQ